MQLYATAQVQLDFELWYFVLNGERESGFGPGEDVQSINSTYVARYSTVASAFDLVDRDI